MSKCKVEMRKENDWGLGRLTRDSAGRQDFMLVKTNIIRKSYTL